MIHWHDPDETDYCDDDVLEEFDAAMKEGVELFISPQYPKE